MSVFLDNWLIWKSIWIIRPDSAKIGQKRTPEIFLSERGDFAEVKAWRSRGHIRSHQWSIRTDPQSRPVEVTIFIIRHFEKWGQTDVQTEVWQDDICEYSDHYRPWLWVGRVDQYQKSNIALLFFEPPSLFWCSTPKKYDKYKKGSKREKSRRSTHTCPRFFLPGGGKKEKKKLKNWKLKIEELKIEIFFNLNLKQFLGGQKTGFPPHPRCAHVWFYSIENGRRRKMGPKNRVSF